MTMAYLACAPCINWNNQKFHPYAHRFLVNAPWYLTISFVKSRGKKIIQGAFPSDQIIADQTFHRSIEYSIDNRRIFLQRSCTGSAHFLKLVIRDYAQKWLPCLEACLCCFSRRGLLFCLAVNHQHIIAGSNPWQSISRVPFPSPAMRYWITLLALCGVFCVKMRQSTF